MNRKSKIVVSVVGITIVALTLLGLTYAYYLTRIEGNTNTNSISVTTADLKLTYDDGDGSVIGNGKTLIPDNDNPVGTKVFTVTNNGNGIIEDYAVIIENFAVKYHSGANAGVITDLVNGEDGEPDMQLVITCKAYENYGKGSQKELEPCNGMDGFLPEKSDILVLNTIDKEITHEYTAVLTYLEDGTNQSDDMNKTIEGKFNIIDTKNTIDVTGTVETYNSGDTVTIHSEPKESVIYTDGTYKFMGVKPDVHTIKVNSVEKGKVSIKGGSEANATGTIINNGIEIPEVTITPESRILTINLKGNLEITEIKDYNPFKEGTLAFEILKKAIIATKDDMKNGISKLQKPISTLGEKISVTNYKNIGKSSTYIQGTSAIILNDETIFFYDSYTVDEDTGKFTLSGKHSCVYSDCYNSIKDKYLSHYGPASITDSNLHISDTKENLEVIYKITDATLDFLNYVSVYPSPNEAERVLSSAPDNNGTSYYYRGDIEDNYVNFAGMCWRIVRIEGDGSIKLVLEDSSYECNSNLFKGNWSDNSTYSFGSNTNGEPDIINYTENSALAVSLQTFQFKMAKKINASITDSATKEEISNVLSSKLKKEEWCIDDIISSIKENRFENYGTYDRLFVNRTPSLKCDGTKLTKFKDGSEMYVGMLSADEVYFGGIVTSGYGSYTYLINNYSKNNKSWWTLSLHYYDRNHERYYGVYVDENARLVEAGIGIYSLYTRPSIVLKEGISATTQNINELSGTISNPYIVG